LGIAAERSLAACLALDPLWLLGLGVRAGSRLLLILALPLNVGERADIITVYKLICARYLRRTQVLNCRSLLMLLPCLTRKCDRFPAPMISRSTSASSGLYDLP
jgi:hypothetical protein